MWPPVERQPASHVSRLLPQRSLPHSLTFQESRRQHHSRSPEDELPPRSRVYSSHSGHGTPFCECCLKTSPTGQGIATQGRLRWQEGVGNRRG